MYRGAAVEGNTAWEAGALGWLAAERDGSPPDGIPGIANSFAISRTRDCGIERRFMREVEGGNAGELVDEGYAPGAGTPRYGLS